MAIGQYVLTDDGYGEIISVSRSRFGATSYKILGDFGEGHYSAHQILSEVEDDETFDTELHWNHDGTGDETSTQDFDEADKDDWLDEGTQLPWNPKPTEEWNGELTQEFDDHNIDLKPTNSLNGADTDPDPEDHNAIFDHSKQANSHYAYDSEDSDWDEDEDYKDREDGKGTDDWNEKKASVGPRQAFVDYIALLDSNSLVREAAWSDVRTKAVKLYREGDVTVKSNDGREIIATVKGDHGKYDVQVHRKNAFGQGITWYDCNCEWGKWAYKRERNFVGRLCSHGLATYYAMQANKQPERDVKRISETTERHHLAAMPLEERPSPSDLYDTQNPADFPSNPNALSDFQNTMEKHVRKAPVSTPVETESLAARQGGLMVWDDNLAKVMDKFFQKPDPAMGADPSPGAPASPGGDPAGTIGPDLSSELASDTPAAPTFDGADNSFEPQDNGTSISDKVRTAEFSKNPDTDDLFESFDEGDDESKFNDAGDHKTYDEKNDPEYAFYDEFWGRSSSKEAGQYDNLFQGGPNPQALMDIAKSGNDAPLPEPGRKLPHFIRRNKQQQQQVTASEDFSVEEHDPAEVQATIKQFRLNGDEAAAKKIIQERRKLIKQHEGAKDSDGDVDYNETPEEDHAGFWQNDPNDGVNGDSDSYNDSEDGYQSDRWQDAEDEWHEFHPGEDEDTFEKSSSFQNEEEARAFNNDSDGIVAEFQRSAAAQALKFSNPSNDNVGAFRTILDDQPMSRTAGRHFTFAEQQELIDEPGTARHFGELNLENSFYLD